MKWQNWYFIFLIVIMLIAVASLPILFPSEAYLKALQG